MRHRKAGRQLRRTSEQRLALLRNLATSLIEQGAIETTEAKAKELRPFVEKLITKARSGTLHARRLAGKHVQKREPPTSCSRKSVRSSPRARAATRAFSRPATARVTALTWRASNSSRTDDHGHQRNRCYVCDKGVVFGNSRLARQQQDAPHLEAQPPGRPHRLEGKTIKIKVCTRCLNAGKIQRAPRGQVAVAV
jgi:ribosomal protein L17